MQRYKLTISYDGSGYAGWQVQPGVKTVQSELERCFREFAGRAVKIHGSGRTDRGVHAAGQVAHLDLPARMEARTIIKAGNALLPPDIRLLKAGPAAPDFHARRDAVCKEYRYFIWNACVLPPFLCRYRTHVRQPLDVAVMRNAAAKLTGKHDFASFTANPSRLVESTVRNLSALAVRRRGKEIVIAVRGDGFLYRMVRSLAGFLIRVGAGDLPAAAAENILARKQRTAVVPTAPPQGLFLWKVYY
ncbi:MAG: tRNA pseudouridine(38-40) synthase TruA [Kiritimatiellae bacterium]|nr:tRNA pseudouridine(38-40) synthase TruA [Kiritimatiellia bacterium]